MIAVYLIEICMANAGWELSVMFKSKDAHQRLGCAACHVETDAFFGAVLHELLPSLPFLLSLLGNSVDAGSLARMSHHDRDKGLTSAC